MVVAFCTVATVTSWKPNLRNACSACWADCGSDFENAPHSTWAIGSPSTAPSPR